MPANQNRSVDLLLLAGEQEDMADRHPGRGEMLALDDGGDAKAECVATKEEDGVYEIRNIAVRPSAQRRGYGKARIDFVAGRCSDCNTMPVGTGARKA